jgi:hypothetical protein
VIFHVCGIFGFPSVDCCFCCVLLCFVCVLAVVHIVLIWTALAVVLGKNFAKKAAMVAQIALWLVCRTGSCCELIPTTATSTEATPVTKSTITATTHLIVSSGAGLGGAFAAAHAAIMTREKDKGNIDEICMYHGLRELHHLPHLPFRDELDKLVASTECFQLTLVLSGGSLQQESIEQSSKLFQEAAQRGQEAKAIAPSDAMKMFVSPDSPTYMQHVVGLDLTSLCVPLFSCRTSDVACCQIQFSKNMNSCSWSLRHDFDKDNKNVGFVCVVNGVLFDAVVVPYLSLCGILGPAWQLVQLLSYSLLFFRLYFFIIFCVSVLNNIFQRVAAFSRKQKEGQKVVYFPQPWRMG